MDALPPPSNVGAEQALLGAILANNKALDLVEEFLRPDHFYDEAHARIFGVIVARVRAGRVADPISLKAELENDGSLQDVGGTEYLAKLVSSLVGIITARDYGEAIRDSWIRRNIVELCSETLSLAHLPPEGGAFGVLEHVENRLLRISEGSGDSQPVFSLGEAVTMAVGGARAASERVGGLAGISSGYVTLDRATTGLMGGEVYVVAGRPAMGKTALGLGIAARSAAAGNRVLYWSGEMTAVQLGARAAAAYANLPTTAVFTGRRLPLPDDRGDAKPEPLESYEWQDLAKAEQEAARLPLDIDDRPALTVALLRARARRMKRSKRGLDLVVVDYLGLMRGSEVARRNGKYAEVTEISADLKSLAKELGIPVLALSQLNRANEAREDKRPNLADLRDSGAIEQDAGVVIFLHREHYYLSREAELEKRDRETDEAFANRKSTHYSRLDSSKGRAELIVAKNRHGPTGTRRLLFRDTTTWFRDEFETELAPAWELTALAP